MSKIINFEELENYQRDLPIDYRLMQRTIIKNGLVNSCINNEVLASCKPVFNIEVDAGDVTDQKRSGRCWMFAGLNVLRTFMMNKLHLKNFELSQSYLQFYDKLEKANFFLERAIELKGEEIDSRLNTLILDNTIFDGGHFIMFTNLVKKYGILPKEFMPETAASSNTEELNTLLNNLLHKDALILREAFDDEIPSLKENMLKEIYKILVISLGQPPKDFTLEIKDKDNNFIRLEKMTPIEFFKKYIDIDLDDYIPLSDIPYKDLKRGECYYSHFVNNVEGGSEVLFYNVPINVLKDAVIKSLKDKQIVWFAADVLSQSLRKEGILASDLIDLDNLCGVTTINSKADRFTTRTSFCNHAMAFTGVNLIDDKPNRFKVENSWGKDNGKDGYFIMSDKWFDDYVYQAVVHKKYVEPKYVEEYMKKKENPIEIPPFNTFFSNF